MVNISNRNMVNIPNRKMVNISNRNSFKISSRKTSTFLEYFKMKVNLKNAKFQQHQSILKNAKKCEISATPKFKIPTPRFSLMSGQI